MSIWFVQPLECYVTSRRVRIWVVYRHVCGHVEHLYDKGQLVWFSSEDAARVAIRNLPESPGVNPGELK